MRISERAFDALPAHLKPCFFKLPNPGRDALLAGFPAQAGGGDGRPATVTPGSHWNIGGQRSPMPGAATYADSGSAARFYYCAKASKRDRDEGCEHLPATIKLIGAEGHSINPTTGRPVVDLPRANGHPTVKPTDLMRWLVRLVAPAGALVFDPFTGSGSTGKAAMLEGRRFIGAEMTPEYWPIARARIARAALDAGVNSVAPSAMEAIE